MAGRRDPRVAGRRWRRDGVEPDPEPVAQPAAEVVDVADEGLRVDLRWPASAVEGPTADVAEVDDHGDDPAGTADAPRSAFAHVARPTPRRPPAEAVDDDPDADRPDRSGPVAAPPWAVSTLSDRTDPLDESADAAVDEVAAGPDEGADADHRAVEEVSAVAPGEEVATATASDLPDVRAEVVGRDGGATGGDADHEWVDADVVDDGHDDDRLPAVPLLPALAGRIESLQSGMQAMAARVDAVTGAMQSFRSSLGDRLEDYAETSARLQRSIASDLDEQRREAARTTADLRRAMVDNETALRRVGARVEEVGTDLAGVADLARRAEAERAQAPRPEELAALVAGRAEEALADDVVALRGEIAEVRAVVEGVAELAGAVADLGQGLGAVAEAVSRLAPRRDVDELRAGVDSLRTEVAREVAVAEVFDGLEALRMDVEVVTDAVRSAARREAAELQRAAAAVAAADLSARLDALVEEVRALRDVEPVVVDDRAGRIDALAGRLDDLARADQVDAVVAAVGGDRLADSLRPDLDALAGRLDGGLASVRDEIVLLKRRVAVRARAQTVLADEQVDHLAGAAADVVVERLAGDGLDALADRVAALVAARLERQFEVVGDASPVGDGPVVPAPDVTAGTDAEVPAPAPRARARRRGG